MRQGQKFPQKFLLRAAKQRHVGARLPAAQNRAQCNHQNLMQQMALGIARAWVLKPFENIVHSSMAPLPSKSAPFGRILPTPPLQ
jgi:hypothetical protein